MYNLAIIVNSLQGGGAERCAADLSMFFSQQGYCVYIFTDLKMKIQYSYSGKLIDFNLTFSVDDKDPGMDALSKKVQELKNLKAKYGIDVAISFMQDANHLNILSKEKEKVILTNHSLISEYAKSRKDVFWSEDTFKNLYQFADYITFPSEYCRRDWIKHYGDKNNITRTVYNPVHSMPVTQNVKNEDLVIAIGRMHSIKRQWHIIRVFKLVKVRCPSSKLVILGDGELRENLKKLIADLQLEKDVEMPGNVTNVKDYLERAKVFTITSQCEAMPCSVLEAMSAGVPVVACDIPGGICEELGIESNGNEDRFPKQSDCGIITPYIKAFYTDKFSDEEIMLADEIAKLLKNDVLWEKMGKAASKRASEFSLEKIGAIWSNRIINFENRRKLDEDEFNQARKRSIDSFCKGEYLRSNMYISYYRLLEKWMLLRENGKSIRLYFEKNGLKNIIIYGMGKMTHHLLADLKESSVNIVCAIDRGATNKSADFPVISDEDDIPNADCIVITPIYDEEAIRESLEDKTQIAILSLSDIVNGC